MAATGAVVESWMYFLKKDPKYDVERIYELRRQKPTAEVPRTNMLLEKVEGVQIHDVRGQECSFGTTGFFLLDMDTKLAAKDFNERNKVVGTFLPQLADAIKAKLNASRVQIFDYSLRKRDQAFPVSSGGPYNYRQPSCLAHIDATPGDIARLRHVLNKADAEKVSNVRCQFVNAWKPLRGPARDWPLALCDLRSVDPETDLKICDLVAPEGVSETASVHHAPTQRWCYVRDQMPTETWVFMQADSNGTTGVPHASFPHPDASEADHLRESIEVRMLVFYEERNEPRSG